MRRLFYGMAGLLLTVGLTTVTVSGANAPKPALAEKDAFIAAPYLQWGSDPNPQDNRLELFWHAEDAEADWSVSYRAGSENGDWKDAGEVKFQRVDVPTIDPHRVYRVQIKDLPYSSSFEYRVKKDDKVVFESKAKTRPKAGEPHRVVIVGDIASGSSGQKRLSAQIAEADPDLIAVPGDIVYSRGRISEYRKRFFPVYNNDEVSAKEGAPILRSTLFLATPGNHDYGARDLESNPDGMGYFLYWSLPLNGPFGEVDAKGAPKLKGPEENQKAFRDAAGETFPRMANFSATVGNNHWLFIDSNSNVNFDDPEFRDWIAKDLASASDADWRFVVFHHPGFNSSKAHFADQRTRLLAEVLEEGNVDLAFAGHVHNYQRTYPLRFKPDRDDKGKPVGKGSHVEGKWTLDKEYDGKDKTQADGVIYLVTGAGGAGLYNPEQQDNPPTWQEFTCKFISDKHSMTVMDVEPGKLTLRQIDADGKERDQFVLTKDR